ALRFGGLVDSLGLVAFADDAADLSLADRHDEFANRRIARKREDVDRLDRGLERVGVLLRDVNRGEVSGDFGLHVRVLERDRNRGGLIGKASEQRAGTGAARIVSPLFATL